MQGAPSSRERGFEVSDASVRAIVISTVAIVVGVVAALAIVRLMMTGPENAPAAFGISGTEASFTHGPAEETGIQQSWKALESDLAESTTGYAWIDREQGIVRLPIARAMELVVAEHAEDGGAP